MNQAIHVVGVVGGGTMGQKIAALIVRSGCSVIVAEETAELAKRVEKNLHAGFEKWSELGQYIKDRDTLEQFKSRVTVTANLGGLVSADLVIEAVFEDMTLKRRIFTALDKIMPGHVPFGSNTSSIPITVIASATKRPDKVLGMHLFNPPTSMPLVELVRGEKTSDDTLDMVEKFARDVLGKQTIRVKDQPGFLVNFFLLPYVDEGIRSITQNDVSFEEIDAEAKKTGWPMGLFAMLDVVGLSTAYSVAEFLSRAYPDKIQTADFLRHLVDSGRLGQKNGLGFYDIKGGHEPLADILQRLYGDRPKISAPEVFQRMTARLLNEVAKAFEDQVTSKDEIETGTRLSIGFPKDGPLHHIDEIGVSNLVKQLNGYCESLGPRFKPAQILVDMADKGERFYKNSGTEKSKVISTVSGNLGFIKFSNPLYNILTREMLESFKEQLSSHYGNPDVKAIIITGEGSYFVAGVDIGFIHAMAKTGNRSAVSVFLKDLHARFDMMSTGKKPVIAGVNGMCWGGGLELALACNYIVVSANCQEVSFACPEVDYGIIPGLGATQRLPRRIEPALALKMLLGGKSVRVSAKEALAMGLVTEIVKEDDFEKGLENFVSRVLQGEVSIPADRNGPRPDFKGISQEDFESFAMNKPAFAAELINSAVNEGLKDYLPKAWSDIELPALLSCFFTADALEGLSSFIEKRRASFRRVIGKA